MDVSAVALQSTGEQMGAKDVLLLKKSQDLMKSQNAQLLAALPAPTAANPPGVGTNIDLEA